MGNYPRCNRNCSFCGSKAVVNVEDELVWDSILTIGDNIAKYAETVIVSGGEPLTIPPCKLKEIKNICVEHGTNLDVVTNRDLLSSNHVGIFRNIGISINSRSDLELLDVDLLKELHEESKIVFITNVNKINDFDLELMLDDAESMIDHFDGFQFQLTMYKDDNPAKIDGEDIAIIREHIEAQCKINNIPYVLADNLQDTHECTAGIYSCGVLYNADVVACLSERSWNDDYEIHGNLLIDDLNDIWRTEFVEQRFGKYDGCRGCFNYVKCKKEDNDETAPVLITEPFNPIPQPKQPFDDQMMLYGVYPPKDVIQPNDQSIRQIVYSYGVYPPDGTSC